MPKKTRIYACQRNYNASIDSSPERIAKALTASNGNILKASTMLDIPFESLYIHLKNNPEFWLLRQQIIDKNLDEAEDQLMTQVRGGNLQAIMFYLKCQGKRRGWVERPVVVPIYHTPNTVLLHDEQLTEQQNSIDLSNYNIEELQQLKTLLTENSLRPQPQIESEQLLTCEENEEELTRA